MILTGWSAENDSSRMFAGGKQAVKDHFISLKLEVNIYCSYGCVTDFSPYCAGGVWKILTVSVTCNTYNSNLRPLGSDRDLRKKSNSTVKAKSDPSFAYGRLSS